MRLRNHMAALALGCATAAATFGQSPPDNRQDRKPPPDKTPPDAPRPVEVRAAPAPAVGGFALTQSDPRQAQVQPPGGQGDAEAERQRAIEIYHAQFGGQLTKASYLGVSTSSVPAALRQHLGLQEGVGLVVDFVEPDSPAQSAGFKQYDILTKLNDQILVNAQQLAVLVRSHKANDEIKLTLIRGGKEQSITAKLVEKEVKPLEDLVWGDGGAMAGEFDRQRAMVGRFAERRNRNNAPQPPVDAQKRSGNRTMSVWRDNDMSITITQAEGDKGRHVVAADKDGKKLFEGNIDNDKERSAMPKAVAEKVKQMESKLRPDAGGGDSKEDKGPRSAVDGKANFNVDESFNFGGADDRRNGERRNEEESDLELAPEAGGQVGASLKSPIRDNDILNIAINNAQGPGVRTVKLARVRDGQVHLPHVAPVKCVGMTADELEKKIVQLYVEQKIAPQVEVRVKKIASADQHASNDKDDAKP
jgi:hypothetical protein